MANFLKSVAPSLISGGVQFAANQLFGPSDSDALAPLQTPQALDFSGGGLFGRNQGGQFAVGTTDGSRDSLVNQIGNFNRGLGIDLGKLREMVTPGFGALTESRVGALDASRRRTVGNLRDNLQRRRIGGSSFAADAVSRAEAEYGLQEADVRARSFLEELDMSTQLLVNETNANINAVTTVLDELNIRLGLASNSAAPLAQMLANAGRYTADIMTQSAVAQGGFINELARPVGDAIGKQWS